MAEERHADGAVPELVVVPVTDMAPSRAVVAWTDGANPLRSFVETAKTAYRPRSTAS